MVLYFPKGVFMFNIFMNKNKNKTLNYLQDEVKKLEFYFYETNRYDSKISIRDKSLFIRLKQKALISNFTFIKNAQKFLIAEEYTDVLSAIEYLNNIKNKILTKKAILELAQYKALLYELTNNDNLAKEAYNIALKHDKTSNTLKEYKSYCERQIGLKKSKTNTNLNNRYYLEEKVSFDKMPNCAQKIENLAKYYAKSKKSLPLAQKYFYESLKIYKQLASYNAKKYNYIYILSLIKSVEIFKMAKDALNEAEALIFNSNECYRTNSYLLNKINRLKGV